MAKNVLCIAICLLLTATTGFAQKAQPETAKPRPIVVGQVYDYVGAGVADAVVTVTLKSTGEKIGEARTDRLGDFAVQSDKPLRGSAVVHVERAPYKPLDIAVELDPDNPPFVAEELVGAIACCGRVIDDRDESPIAGATVTLSAAYRQWSDRADPDGHFCIRDLPPAPAQFTVEAEGYARETGNIGDLPANAATTRPASQPAGQIIFRLKPERIVHLTITDGKGSPIPRVSVEAVDEQRADYRHVITGDDGKVDLRGLSFDARKLSLRLSHADYVSGTDFDRTIDLPADAAESQHTFTMAAAGKLTGTIMDAESRAGVMGARVSVGEVVSDFTPRAWSDMNGKYTVSGVAPGEVVVTVHLSGYAPQLRTTTVEAGDEARVDFRMSPARTIAGTVHDADGKPVAGAHVAATKWQGHETLGLQAMTGPSGRFEILDAPLDTFSVSIYKPGFKPLIDRPIDEGRSDYEFSLAVDERASRQAEAKGPAVGEPAPTFKLTTLDGKTIDLGELRGKTVLLDFWATWCGPCLAELPNMQAVYKDYGSRPDFVMIGISLDSDADALRKFVKDRQMGWNHACCEAGHAEEIAEKYGVFAIPSIYLIGPDGKIVATDLRGAALQQAVRERLESTDSR